MTGSSPTAIEIDGLWKRFRKGGTDGLLWEVAVRGVRQLLSGRSASDSFWALQDVNLRVRRGEAVGIIGPNGAGKSTMLKILSRVLRPDRGRIQVNGRLSGLIEVGAGFHGDLSGRENIYVNGAILGMSRAEIRRKFDRIVEFAGIGEFLDMPVKRYSSGMYVRLGFSIAAHMEPEVLLVDEVLSVGDVSFKAKCMDAMRNFLRRGTSVLFVSHNLAQIKRFCDRVVLLDHGRVRLEGTPDAAIAEYSRLVSDLEDANPQGIEQSHVGGRARSKGPARITAVRILNGEGQPSRTFVSGEPVRLEIDYDIDPASGGLVDPNFAIAVHMFGAGLFYQFESRRDGLRPGRCVGKGTVAVDFPKLSLGEGVYQVSVALADEKGLPEHDWHDRAYRITVVPDGVTDGPVHQPRSWELLEGSDHQEAVDGEGQVLAASLHV
ncbi:MAG TPA: ABC transporter ATP-binding protein [Phycisphaerae bacterium]|nr:ABC transporter ATP-binding protein [Phycisphaerae bacterium]HOJ72685.1 ABC transporter ATP-binding protein [Phycisphaerae bacterium]HOM49654.1 ABC transporter ATP-binding protein [Phycisphaerae bacterium]HOQ84088.1 ABC transporter ATP-binding protein [Phycisphaerae bacterium]HPP25023.1 ABC transporter ATP-binding protein [Phycisphaerae bacterium]